MSRLRAFLSMHAVPRSTDLALLVLRVWSAGMLIYLHGWMKVGMLSAENVQFFDPFGFGPRISVGMAVTSEVICATLVIIGLATRWAALALVASLTTTFIVAHHHLLKGPGSGELPFLYLACMFVILLAGPGRYSIDGD